MYTYESWICICKYTGNGYLNIKEMGIEEPILNEIRYQGNWENTTPDNSRISKS